MFARNAKGKKGERNVYKVEIKPGVGFSQGFKTKIEALIFIRDFNNILKELGIIPFQCEIIEIKERSVPENEEGK